MEGGEHACELTEAPGLFDHCVEHRQAVNAVHHQEALASVMDLGH